MRTIGLLFAALFVASQSAYAQKKDHHDEPKHGGVIVEAGAHHLELVVKDKVLTLYVTDMNGKPVDVTGAKAQGTVFSGKDKATIDFSPSPGGIMKGEAGVAIRADAKVVLNFTPAKGKAEQTRFQLGAKPDHKGHKHSSR